MRETPSDKQSTTKKRSKSKAVLQFKAERTKAEADAVAIPEQEPNNQKTKHVYMTVNLADYFIASYQTGAYPRTSFRGNKYICVFYIFDPNYNYIKGNPIKSRHSSKLLKAYKDVYHWCESRGFKPVLHCMDNETPKEVEDFIQSHQTDLHYLPPGRHCRPAEKQCKPTKSASSLRQLRSPRSFQSPPGAGSYVDQIDFAVNIVRPCRQTQGSQREQHAPETIILTPRQLRHPERPADAC